MAYIDLIGSLVRDKAAAENLSLIDAAREWCRGNSIHAMDQWWTDHANDYSYVLEHMYKTAVGDPTAETVELLCGNMVNVLAAVLGNLGITSRGIWLYRNNNDFHTGHTYLEVFNDATQKWEIQDADYNVYYVDLRTGQRASVADMMAAPDADCFIPCNAQATGWFDTGAEPLRLASFHATQVIVPFHTLYANAGSANQATLDSIAAELGGADYSYTTTIIDTFPGYTHLIDTDAVFDGGRNYLVGGGGADFVSYDGVAGSTALAVLNGGAGDDVIAAKWSVAQLYGGPGNDILIGSVGADLLVGGPGDDYMSGGWGADQYLFAHGSGFNDTIDGFGNGGADKIVFQGVYGYGAPRAGTQTISGGEFAERISQTLTTAGVKVFYDLDADHVWDGSFLLEGLSSFITTLDVTWIFAGPLTEANAIDWNGTRLLAGSASADTILYNGTVTATLAGSLTGSGSGSDYIAATSSAAVSIYGHDGDDTLIGGSRGDLIVGGTGDDTMTGGGGADLFAFASGDGFQDIITDLAVGADKLLMLGVTGLGGAGAGDQFISASEFGFRVLQTVGVQGVTLQYDVNGDGRMDGSMLLAGVFDPIAATDVIWRYAPNAEAEITTASQPSGTPAYPQQIIGSATGGDKIVYSGIQAAVLGGLGGDDQIQSRSAANTSLYGHAGDDTLIGGAGSDFIVGGPGDDFMRGNGGHDAFALAMGDGFHDVVEDFTAGIDDLVFVGVSGPGLVAGGGAQTLSDSAFSARVEQTWLAPGELQFQYDINGNGVTDGAIIFQNMTAFITTSDVFWV